MLSLAEPMSLHLDAASRAYIRTFASVMLVGALCDGSGGVIGVFDPELPDVPPLPLALPPEEDENVLLDLEPMPMPPREEIVLLATLNILLPVLKRFKAEIAEDMLATLLSVCCATLLGRRVLVAR